MLFSRLVQTTIENSLQAGIGTTGALVIATFGAAFVGSRFWFSDRSVYSLLWEGRPQGIHWYTIVLFPIAIYRGLRTYVENIYLITDLIHASDQDRLAYLPQDRVIVEGEVEPDTEPITCPVSREDAVVVEWRVENYDRVDNMWYEAESGVRMSAFRISDDHGEVLVDTGTDAIEYEFQDDHRTVIEGDDISPEKLPSHLERYFETHSDDGGSLRFIEHRVEPGDIIGASGSVSDTNVRGRWQRRFIPEDWIGIGDDADTIKNVFWIRVFTNLFWGSLLLTLGQLVPYLITLEFLF